MRNYTTIRRNLQFLLIVILLTALMLVFVFIQLREKTDSPVFSAESGFYEDAFYLEINVPEGCSVYYTLDSTIPDHNSIPYTGPIYIDNASYHENTYSMVEGMTSNPHSTVLPDYLIDKCTVIRAIAIMDNNLRYQKSNVVTKSYFVGFPPNHYDNCGVISLVTSPENLFDSRTGIYVTGDIMEKYRSMAYVPDVDAGDYTSWGYWPANYTQRGREWEREANITFLDADGNVCLEKDIGIRIQGNWSRAFVPKGLNLYAREEYDGEAYFPYDFFGHSLKLETLTFSAGGSGGQINQLNNYLLSECVQGLSFDVKTHRPYVLFLDGEYWGFYWLTERTDATYLRERYDLGSANPIVIKQTELEEGFDEGLVMYQQMLQFFKDTDLSIEENYARACEIIDIDSFIDYYATQIYIARSTDWPIWNEAMWRTRETSGGAYADGKWRWILFDCDSYCMTEALINHDTLEDVSMENVQVDAEYIAYIEKTIADFDTYWLHRSPFRSLWKNPMFRAAFETRILEIADQHFEAKKMERFLEDYRETMVAPLSKSWSRFGGSNNNALEQFTYDLNSTLAFFNQRRDVVASWFDE